MSFKVNGVDSEMYHAEGESTVFALSVEDHTIQVILY